MVLYTDQHLSTANRVLMSNTSKPTTSKPELSHPNAKVLLVEDNEINQRITVFMLKALGVLVDVVDNGADALAKLDENTYDIILMDVGLPDMSGYSITQLIRGRPDNKAQTPIIALTAYASEDEHQQCLQSGMNDVLTKPISQDNLRQSLTHWMPVNSENA